MAFSSNLPQNDLERLFLMEFMINNIHYANDAMNLDKDFLSSLGPTCVKIKFKDYPVLEICEDDFVPKDKPYENTDVKFKSGKSCLFALRQQNGMFSSNCFEVLVSVFRKILSGGGKGSFKVGDAVINLTQSFTNLLMCNNKTPACRSIKDVFNIKNDKNVIVGSICIFIRVSSFGKMIMTQFQLGGDGSSSFLFKGTNEQKSSINDMKYDQQQPWKGNTFDGTPTQKEPFIGECPGLSGATDPYGMSGDQYGLNPLNQGQYNAIPNAGQGMNGMGGPTPGFGYGQNPGGMYNPYPMGPYGMGQDPFGQGQFGMQQNPLMMDGQGIGPGGFPMATAGYPMVGPPMGYIEGEPVPDPCDTDEYKTLTAEVNGYALKIRILRRPKKKID